MPYFAATYASNVDKIFATMGPYIVKCNATTGARESFTKLAATAIYGDMSIVYHSGVGKLFVGPGNTPVKQSDNAWFFDPPVYKDLYQVDPSTMAVVPTGIITKVNDGFGPEDGLRGGPYFLMADGIYVYFLWAFGNASGNEWGRIEATPPFAYNGGDGFRFRTEQLSVGASYGDYVYRLDPRQLQVEYLNKTGIQPNGGFVGSTSISPHTPLGICRGSDDLNYIVCGDDNLIRQESLTNLDYTVLNLSAVIGPALPPDPCRIRSLSNGKLYMPCMTANGVIVYTPGTAIASAVWHGGFEGPIDVVETGSKIFVVQNSPIGLKELI